MMIGGRRLKPPSPQFESSAMFSCHQSVYALPIGRTFQQVTSLYVVLIGLSHVDV